MAGEQVIVLREVYQFPTSQARFDRHHLLLYRDRAVGSVQEYAGECKYVIFQLANSPVRIELSDGGVGRPPIVEVSKDGHLIFRCVLGGRRPRPIKIGQFRFVPCVWGQGSPQALWGPDCKVENVGGEDEPPSREGDPSSILI
jgi:hypothetical protein